MVGGPPLVLLAYPLDKISRREGNKHMTTSTGSGSGLSGRPGLVAALAVAAALLVAFVAWLAFGFFGIQSAFLDDEVSEDGPVFGSTEEAEILDSAEFQEAMEEAEANTSEAAEEMPEEMVSTLFTGAFSGNSRYEITGDALVLNDGSEQRFLRFENFESSNGPDLKVYLRAADGNFVSLGDLKGNIGDQNYEIPTDVDLDVFSTVEIWCERFSVGFGQAELA